MVREPASEKDIWWAAPDGQPSNGAPNYDMDERWAATVLDPHCKNRWQDEGHLGGRTLFLYEGLSACTEYKLEAHIVSGETFT